MFARAVIAGLVLMAGVAFAQDDAADRHFLPARIGARDHGGFGDSGMSEQYALDLGGVNVLAA